jgi:hypothetical protein
MSAFEQHLYDVAREAFDRIPEDERPQTYAASFFTYDEHDDPRFPTVAVGYVTEEDGWPGDDLEARWNLFKPPELAIVFDTSLDPPGAAIRDSWAREHGLWYELDTGEEAHFNERGEPLTRAFVAAEIEVVRRLHAAGDVVRLFGRPIPVLIHELEYYEAIAEQNIAANPPGLVDDFARYCRGDEY